MKPSIDGSPLLLSFIPSCLQFKLELRKEDKEKLIELMRKQFSTIRVAYNMLNGRRDVG